MTSAKKLNIEAIVALCRDQEKLVETLQEWGVIAKEGLLKCPDCSAPLKLFLHSAANDGYIWECCNKISINKKKAKKCGKRQSLRKNTFFDKSHLSIKQIMIFVRLWCSNVEIQTIEEEAEISGRTAVDWNSFCREVAVDFCLRREKPIGGPNMTVEIDESKFGKRKYHRGHFVEGQWVFGGVCRETGDVFLAPVERLDSSTLIPLIEKWIAPGSTIISDCWKAYDCLDESAYTHLKVNHSINFKDPTTGAHSNTIEGLWRHAKRKLPEYNRKKSFFTGYLSKFLFINFCRMNKLDPTVEFFKAAGTLYSPYSIVEDIPSTTAQEDTLENDEDNYQ